MGDTVLVAAFNPSGTGTIIFKADPSDPERHINPLIGFIDPTWTWIAVPDVAGINGESVRVIAARFDPKTEPDAT